MRCPRLDHFLRFNADGTVSRCGHMIRAPKFQNLDELENSEWLSETKQIMAMGKWPKECVRCEQTESLAQTSIRLNYIEFDKKQKKQDYLTIGGVLDNICNSACQMCNASLSTLIGALSLNSRLNFNNAPKFWKLPLDRVVHLDINGGEPSASKNYKHLLNNIPKNVKSIRINTNCGIIIPEIEMLLDNGIDVTVTVSFDGIEKVHNYVRWPLQWEKYYKNLMTYKSMPMNLNLWTTVNALNIGNLSDIFSFAEVHELDHSWALLDAPRALNVKYKNRFTTVKDIPKVVKNAVAIDVDNEQELQAYIDLQDSIRKINYKEYLF